MKTFVLMFGALMVTIHAIGFALLPNPKRIESRVRELQ